LIVDIDVENMLRQLDDALNGKYRITVFGKYLVLYKRHGQQCIEEQEFFDHDQPKINIRARSGRVQKILNAITHNKKLREGILRRRMLRKGSIFDPNGSSNRTAYVYELSIELGLSEESYTYIEDGYERVGFFTQGVSIKITPNGIILNDEPLDKGVTEENLVQILMQIAQGRKKQIGMRSY